MHVDERPARKNIQELQGLILLAADARCHYEHQVAHVERNKYRHKTLLKETLKVIVFRLQTRIKSVAREEEKDSDEDDAQLTKEPDRTGCFSKLLRKMVDDYRYRGKALYRLGPVK